MKAHGFTLIELMVAVLLLALLSGGAVFSFRQPLNALRIDSAVMTLRQFDADTRSAARASGQPQRMILDLSRHRLQRFDGADFATLRRQDNVGALNWQVAIEGEPRSLQVIAIDVSADGWSRSYTVLLSNRTLQIAGLTGQITEQR